MRAAVFEGAGRIQLREAMLPAIGEDEVLVRIRAAAICGTDLRIYKAGYHRIPEGSRRVLGHELAGEIVEAGRLAGWRPGTRVVVAPNVGCGRCELCRKGFNQLCLQNEILGITLDGAFQDCMRLPAAAVRGGNVFALPPEVSFEEAALIEPLSCCYSAFRGLRVTQEDSVLVIGVGPIGACHIMLARLAGARQVIAAGRRDERLVVATAFGAHASVNAAQRDLKVEIMRLTEGRGVDVVIVAASVPELQALALELAAIHGRVSFFGGLPARTLVPLDTNLVHYRALQLSGTTGSSNEDFHRTLQLVAEGRVPVGRLVGRRFALTEIHAALDHALSRPGSKTVVSPA